jgi:deazaflavin-dependent oxidoreductase (nitroreductase family)
MKKQPGGKSKAELAKRLTSFKSEEYCYLTTIGRVTGKPHEIEIWFGLNNATFYLLSGGMDKSDWVKNLLKNPAVSVRVAKHTFVGTARLVNDEKDEMVARYLLAEKYQEWESGRTLSEWARTALVIAIDLTQGA